MYKHRSAKNFFYCFMEYIKWHTKSILFHLKFRNLTICHIFIALVFTKCYCLFFC